MAHLTQAHCMVGESKNPALKSTLEGLIDILMSEASPNKNLELLKLFI